MYVLPSPVPPRAPSAVTRLALTDSIRLTTLRWPPSRLTLALAAGLLVVALLVAGGWWWTRLGEHRASTAYADALARLTGGDPQSTPEVRAAAAASLEATLARHPSAALAPLAAYELGNVRYAERAWGRARAAYQIAVARATSPTLRTLARAGVGYTWEAERNYENAIEAFRVAAAGLRPGDFQYEALALDLARAQELAGRKADAIETYRRLLKDAPRSPRADEVRTRLSRLGAGP